MKLKIVDLTGHVISAELEPADPTSKLKDLIQDEVKIPQNQQQLKFGSTVLQDHKSLDEQNVGEGTELRLICLPWTETQGL